MFTSIENFIDKNIIYDINRDKVIIVDPLKTSVTISEEIKLIVVDPIKKSVQVSRQIKLIVIDPQRSFQSKPLWIKHHLRYKQR